VQARGACTIRLEAPLKVSIIGSVANSSSRPLFPQDTHEAISRRYDACWSSPTPMCSVCEMEPVIENTQMPIFNGPIAGPSEQQMPLGSGTPGEGNGSAGHSTTVIWSVHTTHRQSHAPAVLCSARRLRRDAGLLLTTDREMIQADAVEKAAA